MNTPNEKKNAGNVSEKPAEGLVIIPDL